MGPCKVFRTFPAKVSSVYYLPGSDSGNSEKDIPLAKETGKSFCLEASSEEQINRDRARAPLSCRWRNCEGRYRTEQNCSFQEGSAAAASGWMLVQGSWATRLEGGGAGSQGTLTDKDPWGHQASLCSSPLPFHPA